MKIDNVLKDNLIADVENIIPEIKLSEETIESLKRCFEITIGHHFDSPFLPSGTANDIFNKFCTLMNKDYCEYIIKDKKGFVKALNAFARQSNVIEMSSDEVKKTYKAILKNSNSPLPDKAGTAEDVLAKHTHLSKTYLLKHLWSPELCPKSVIEAMHDFAAAPVREELIKFLEFYLQKYEMTFTDGYKQHLIDEYLNPDKK